MDVDTLIDAYIANGVDGANDSLKMVDAETRAMLLEDLESRDFQVHWHSKSKRGNKEEAYGVVLAGPIGLHTDANSPHENRDV
jgi:hypothetical protein